MVIPSSPGPSAQVKVCDVCGDPGFEDCLAHCSQCNVGAEHSYCMWTLLDAVPLDWVCEACKLKKVEAKCIKRPATFVNSSSQSSVKRMNSKGAPDLALKPSGIILGLASTKNLGDKTTVDGSSVEDGEIVVHPDDTMPVPTKIEPMDHALGSVPLSNTSALETVEPSSVSNSRRSDSTHPGLDLRIESNRLTTESLSQMGFINKKPQSCTLLKSNSFKTENDDLSFLLPSRPKTLPRSNSASGRLSKTEANDKGRLMSNRRSNLQNLSANDYVLEMGAVHSQVSGKSSTSKSSLKGSTQASSTSWHGNKSPKGDVRAGGNEISRASKPSGTSNWRSGSSVGYPKIRETSYHHVEKGSLRPHLGSETHNLKVGRGCPVGGFERKHEFRAKPKVTFGEVIAVSEVHKEEPARLANLNNCNNDKGVRLKSSEPCQVGLKSLEVRDGERTRVLGSNNDKGVLGPPPSTNRAREMSPAQLPRPTTVALSGVTATSRLRASSGIQPGRGTASELHTSKGTGLQSPLFKENTDLPSVHQQLGSNNLSLEVQAMPDIQMLWSGSFHVFSSSLNPVSYHGMQAHPCNLADPKVWEATSGLPFQLHLEELKRGVDTDAWLSAFLECPNSRHIGVYFFAVDMGSHDLWYKPLVERMVAHDLVLRAKMDSVHLFVFPSLLLPATDQRWDDMEYLWGVFRAHKGKAAQETLKPLQSGASKVSSSDGDIGNDLISLAANGNGEVIDMEIDESGGQNTGSRAFSETLNGNSALVRTFSPGLPSPTPVPGKSQVPKL